MATKSISRNFAMVADGHHRGSGKVNKGKNIADSSGNITFSSSVEFLYNQMKAMKKRGNKSMLLGVLHGDTGLDPLKKRLNSYGFFGKKVQNDTSKFDEPNLQTIYLWGQNISGFELGKLNNTLAALTRRAGDPNANYKNYEKSPKFKDALKMARTMFMLVVAHYDESFFAINEDDDTQATLSMAYVRLGTGRFPMISPFDPDSDNIQELEWNGEKVQDYPLDTEGTISLSTTRSYLKNFGGTSNANLRSYESSEKDGSKFWSANLLSLRPEEFPASVAVHFSEETRELMKSVDYINLSYVFGQFDDRTINDILEGNQDAVLGFTGLIEDDPENSKRISVYESKPNDEGKTYKTLSIRVRQGTFYTQKLL